MRVLSKFFIFAALLLLLKSHCLANKTRILVTPLNVPTALSSAGIYTNVSEQIASDVINNLNKNLLYEVMDINSAESLIMSYGLWEKYQEFLKNYKDRGIVDYKVCEMLQEKLGINKVLLVSSGFSMQSMMLKRPFWYKIGVIEYEPIQSYYRLDVFFTLIDARSGIIDFERKYQKDFKAETLEVPSSSLSDNIVSSEKIKDFSKNLSREILTDVCITTNQSAYTNVKSSIVSSRDGYQTMDGHSFISNSEYLKNKRKDSFKKWIKSRMDF